MTTLGMIFQISLVGAKGVECHGVSPVDGIQQLKGLRIMRHIGVARHIGGHLLVGLVQLQAVPVDFSLADKVQTGTHGVEVGTRRVTIRREEIAQGEGVAAVQSHAVGLALLRTLRFLIEIDAHGAHYGCDGQRHKKGHDARLRFLSAFLVLPLPLLYGWFLLLLGFLLLLPALTFLAFRFLLLPVCLLFMPLLAFLVFRLL